MEDEVVVNLSEDYLSNHKTFNFESSQDTVDHVLNLLLFFKIKGYLIAHILLSTAGDLFNGRREASIKLLVDYETHF